MGVIFLVLLLLFCFVLGFVFGWFWVFFPEGKASFAFFATLLMYLLEQPMLLQSLPGVGVDIYSMKTGVKSVVHFVQMDRPAFGINLVFDQLLIEKKIPFLYPHHSLIPSSSPHEFVECL